MGELFKLSELAKGSKGKIERIEGTIDFQRKIMEMGFIKGTEITLVRKAPLGDPLQVQLEGHSIAIRKKDSRNIFVKKD
ncbi:MAG: ferrous iron transport protein A [Candidatus Diapherotrites archaeon CG11_big_fil_rev_8_21_14_0_20_37_9]|nr:MAG: ferrous iron transport protein A [Candidatus Diapherotrites archaeon CG11_big_fil_rev_8_21_14_0_20_37_9]